MEPGQLVSGFQQARFGNDHTVLFAVVACRLLDFGFFRGRSARLSQLFNQHFIGNLQLNADTLVGFGRVLKQDAGDAACRNLVDKKNISNILVL